MENVELRRAALSDREGEGTLVTGPSFEANMGLSTLAGADAATAGSETIAVPLARLDELAAGERIGLLKIDVEGHETEVLRGAERLLTSGAVRDIVFEDHDPYPSEATAIAEAAGYELISLDCDLRGLRLVAPRDRGEVRAWPGPSYLATLDPERAVRRLSPKGWQVERDRSLALAGPPRPDRLSVAPAAAAPERISRVSAATSAQVRSAT